METIFSKARALVLANLHGLLDKAIDMNSPEVVRQHVRDLGAARDDVRDQAAVAHGRVTDLERQVADLNLRMTETNHNIDLLLGDSDASNDSFATPLEQKLIGYEATQKSLGEQLTDAKELESQLTDAKNKLTSRYDAMVQRVSQLEQIDRAAKAKNQAASALRSATDLASGGPDLDNVEAGIRSRGAVADARFDDAIGGMGDNAEDAVVASEAAARIAERRARLQAAAAPAAAPAAETAAA